MKRGDPEFHGEKYKKGKRKEYKVECIYWRCTTKVYIGKLAGLG